MKLDFSKTLPTPLYFVDRDENTLYIKRDDLYPFSFGGNKARKGLNFYKEFKAKKADFLVTYGSTSSNHARIIANIAASSDVPCIIISPEEVKKETFNKKIIEGFGAKFVFVPVNRVASKIEELLSELREDGYTPYFIEGGGHGNIGTESYRNCYDEIKAFEAENNMKFDYIFHATGTGTTQAGLVSGKLMSEDDTKIIGISIARNSKRGRPVVIKSTRDYLSSQFTDKEIDDAVIFEDRYTAGGYGSEAGCVEATIDYVMEKYGIPLDRTYTAKAWHGMTEYIDEKEIKGKNILFIHTGGAPLYFDYIMEKNKETGK